jgi:arginyl-tRNA synthetase
MKDQLKDMVLNALERASKERALPSADVPAFQIDEPKAEAHGDFSTNVAMVSASVQKMAPRKIAEILLNHLEDPQDRVEKIEIAGPGFINFFIRPAAWSPVLRAIHEADTQYGACNLGEGQRVQVEFVSANPTGPLHVGHGRGAAVGDAVANILSFCGYRVDREYYINDSGRQIATLGRSVYLRLKQRRGEPIEFPKDCYQGDYIVELAEKIESSGADRIADLSEDAFIDFCARFAADEILAGIRADLEAFGVFFERWYSEQELYDSGKVDQAIKEGQASNYIYKKDGALWFNSSRFGDEKDRVVVRQNGLTTYFASDIAYHQDKFRRGYKRVIDVWGADHHGYIPRMTASIQAAGYDRDFFQVVLVHLVNLLRGGVPVAMSTRAGEFVTLKDVVDEVGRDAARFIFLTRHYESPLDFDLEVAKQKTNDNPVYYVQYVHARISSILEKGSERGVGRASWKDEIPSLLNSAEDVQVMKALARYPEVVKSSAEFLEPHRITFYLMNLASIFHAYYTKHRVLTDTPELTNGRLYLIEAVQKVIRNGLSLLGVSAPKKM